MRALSAVPIVEARRSIFSSCMVTSSTPSPRIPDRPPIDEIEGCRCEPGLTGTCIPSNSSIACARLDRLSSSVNPGKSFSGPESLLPGIVDGHEQLRSLRLQPPQIGLASSHFFFRRLQVQHPVRTRTIRVVRGCRSGGIAHEVGHGQRETRSRRTRRGRLIRRRSGVG